MEGRARLHASFAQYREARKVHMQHMHLKLYNCLQSTSYNWLAVMGCFSEYSVIELHDYSNRKARSNKNASFEGNATEVLTRNGWGEVDIRRLCKEASERINDGYAL